MLGGGHKGELTASSPLLTPGHSLLPSPSPRRKGIAAGAKGKHVWRDKQSGQRLLGLCGQASSDFSWDFSGVLPVVEFFWLLWFNSFLTNPGCADASAQCPPAKAKREQGETRDGITTGSFGAHTGVGDGGLNICSVNQQDKLLAKMSWTWEPAPVSFCLMREPRVKITGVHYCGSHSP